MGEIVGFIHGSRVSLPEGSLAGEPQSRFPAWAPPSMQEPREPTKAEIWKPGQPCPYCGAEVHEVVANRVSKGEPGHWRCTTPGCTWHFFQIRMR